mmetsp:Transcript_18673/g.59105  ORF Transcript_18673/g.59105 Transcript_18673/m.59105 type:complete len:275 (+) Transcript_18673:245-1069(+)
MTPAEPPPSSDVTCSSPQAGWRRKMTPEQRRRAALDGRSALPPVLTPETALKVVSRERARKRWSRLVGAKQSRVATEMREHLGHQQWNAFVRFVNEHYMDSFIEAFVPKSLVLACEGPIEGGACPHAFKIDLSQPRSVDDLDALHVDHAHDLMSVCSLWKRIVPLRPKLWHQGRNKRALCQALVGMEPFGCMQRCLHFRCGNKMHRRPSHIGKAPHSQWCHRHGAHHDRCIRAEDLRAGILPSVRKTQMTTSTTQSGVVGVRKRCARHCWMLAR